MQAVLEPNLLLRSNFAASAEMADIVHHIETVVAPAFLQEKGFCLLIVDAEGRAAFDAWQEQDRFNPYNQGTASMGSGFFGLRIPDTPEAVQDVTKILKVAETGRYLVVHHPKRRGEAVRYSRLALR